MGSIGKTSTLLSTTVVTLGTVLSIGDYSFSRGDIEDTAYGTGLWRTFIAGLIDGGSIPFTIAQAKTEAGINTLDGLFTAGTSETWTLTFPDSSKWVFTGYVNSIGGSQPLDGLVTMSFSVRVDGKTPPDYTAGT
jgi:hypothetical protein